MKSQIVKFISVCIAAVFLLGASGMTQAAHYGHGGGGWHGHGGGGWGGGYHRGGWGGGGVFFGVGPGYYYDDPYYYNYGSYYHCRWVRAHWEGGYWIHAHRACWYY